MEGGQGTHKKAGDGTKINTKKRKTKNRKKKKKKKKITKAAKCTHSDTHARTHTRTGKRTHRCAVVTLGLTRVFLGTGLAIFVEYVLQPNFGGRGPETRVWLDCVSE